MTEESPADIDLETSRSVEGALLVVADRDQNSNLTYAAEHIHKLIAAVETLREQLVVARELKKGYYDEAAEGWSKYRAAEAINKELVGALGSLIRRLDSHFGGRDRSTDWKEQAEARAALAKARP